MFVYVHACVFESMFVCGVCVCVHEGCVKTSPHMSVGGVCSLKI